MLYSCSLSIHNTEYNSSEVQLPSLPWTLPNFQATLDVTGGPSSNAKEDAENISATCSVSTKFPTASHSALLSITIAVLLWLVIQRSGLEDPGKSTAIGVSSAIAVVIPNTIFGIHPNGWTTMSLGPGIKCLRCLGQGAPRCKLLLFLLSLCFRPS